MQNVLVINCGSSSLKYQLLDMDSERVLASGLVERIGESNGKVSHHSQSDIEKMQRVQYETPIADHRAAMGEAVGQLTAPVTGVISGPSEIEAVGHRVVHGGEYFQQPTLVNRTVCLGLSNIHHIVKAASSKLKIGRVPLT